MSPVAKKSKGARPRGREVAREKAPPAPSLNLYRRIAVGFVLCVALMLGAVVYVSTVSATIRVVPATTTVATDFLVDVVAVPTRATEVQGTVAVATVGKTQTFSPAGGGVKEVEEKAGGMVTIVNNSTRAQPLVATTRLLSPDGTLFRIDDTVSVPAGGSVEVSAHADVAGASGDIAPARFTIPGLSESLQAQIYAESSVAFTGGVRSVAVIGQQDIDRSSLSLRGALEEEAKAALRAQAGDAYPGESFSFEVLEQSSDVPPGTEASEFALSMSMRATGVFFDRSALQELAVRKLYEQLDAGSAFRSLDGSSVQASVESSDAESGTANLRAYLDGVAIASVASDALDPARFAGMTAEEVRTLLTNEGIATDVSVEFTPFWLKSIPRLKDHIDVVIE